MPQVTKGGKFVFGWSCVGENGAITLLTQTVNEYDIASEGAVIETY